MVSAVSLTFLPGLARKNGGVDGEHQEYLKKEGYLS